MRRTRSLWISVLIVLTLVIASLVGFALGLKPTLGLDLEGGVSIILKAPDGTPSSVMQQALENIRRRVDSVGVAEPDIFLSGTNIEVQLPGLAKGTIVHHPKAQYCAIGPEPATKQPTSFGCFAAQDDAQSSLDAVTVKETTQTVCITDDTKASTSSCFDTQTAADTALKALAVQKETTGDNAGKYCITGGSAIFTCFDTQKAADAAKATYATTATTQFCLSSTSPNLALPCFPTKAEADAELTAIKVTHETTEYCVVSSAGVNLGCHLTLAEAQVGLQQTGQQKLLQLIGTTARLEEREVLSVLHPGDAGYDTQQLTCDNDPKTTTPDCPATPESLAKKDVWFMGQDGSKYHLGPVQITGDQISKATGTFQQSTTSNVGAQWVVDFNLTSSGANIFANVTRQLVGKQLAIILDAKVISAPVINEPITGGRGTISGSFTEQSSKDLATVLNAGALPVQLQRQQVETVSPTLGQQSLHQGILAGVAGLIALFLYLLFYYRLLGVVAWLGMSIWAILAIALISVAGSAVGYALSLAGIAGLVISLGVTADSYIVFFERLKDEVRSGKSPRSAVQPAFKRAYKTIVAADSVTGIAAVVLYITAVSSVRGFALTLGVATLLDLFVVYFFKRPTVFLIARNERLVNLKGFGLTSGVAGEAEPDDIVIAPVAGGAK